MISTFLSLAGKRKKIEAATLLTIHTMASRGESKNVKEMHKELTR